MNEMKTGSPEKILLVATPCLGDRFEGPYFRSMLGLQHRMTAAGITMVTLTKNCSLIALARNDCAAAFRNAKVGDKKITHMIFIDSDVGFDPADVERMLDCDEPVIAGSYPLKKFNWAEMQMVVAAEGHSAVNASLPARTSGSTIGTWSETVKDGELMALKLDERGLCKVETVGTGFMMIKREVFDQVEKLLQGTRDGVRLEGQTFYKTSEGVQHTCFFNTAVREGRFIGEDVYFCGLLADAGIPLLVDSKCKLTHTGSYTWEGGGSVI